MALVMIIIGAALYAMGVGKMSALAQMLVSDEIQLQQKLTTVNGFMQSRSVPRELRERVVSFYETQSRHRCSPLVTFIHHS